MFERISMKKAREKYLKFQDFWMCASNLRPEIFGVPIDGHSFERMTDTDFDYMVDMFKYYNCTSRETGRRVAFYVKVS